MGSKETVTVDDGWDDGTTVYFSLHIQHVTAQMCVGMFLQLRGHEGETPRLLPRLRSRIYGWV
jgi:hypothetical protein